MGMFVSLTNTALSVWRGLVPSVTGALVSSSHVHTLSISAQVLTQLTLVHICSETQIKKKKSVVDAATPQDFLEGR